MAAKDGCAMNAPILARSTPKHMPPTLCGLLADLKTRVLASSQKSARVIAASTPHVPVFEEPCARKPSIHLSASATSYEKNMSTLPAAGGGAASLAAASAPAGAGISPMSSGGSCETTAS